jgi:hypothetical protein
VKNKKTPALVFEEQESSACQQAVMANSIAVELLRSYHSRAI